MSLTLHLIVYLVAVLCAGWLDNDSNVFLIWVFNQAKTERKACGRLGHDLDTPTHHLASHADIEEAFETRKECQYAKETAPDPASDSTINKQQNWFTKIEISVILD